MDTTTNAAIELRRDVKQSSKAPGAQARRMPSPPGVGPVVAEQISDNELRLIKEAEAPPAPEKMLEAVPVTKTTLVTPVQVDGEMFKGFLDGLARVAGNGSEVPILHNVRMTCGDGKLLLEATDGRSWAFAEMK